MASCTKDINFFVQFFLVSVAAAGTFDYLNCMCNLYVVVQFYPWLKFCFPLFLGRVMHDNDMIMSLKQKKLKTKDKIEPQHIYIIMCLQ